MDFDSFISQVLVEAEQPPAAPQDDQSQGGGEDAAALGGEGGEEDMGNLDFDAGELGEPDEEEKTFPEEIELAKLAVRALYFNIDSKNIEKYNMIANGQKIPFEKVSDYFEETKNFKPVLGFIEFLMDKFEGLSSKWTEQPEIRGKGILAKIEQFNKNLPEDERLDNGKRVYWVRLILNCLLYGDPSYNLTIDDVNEKNIKEVYRKLKQDFGRDTRGFLQNIGLRGPGMN